MATEHDIIIVSNSSGDWTCAYVDGTEVYQGHHVDWSFIIEQFRTFSGVIANYEIDDEDLERLGAHFPPQFEDIAKEVY